VGIYTVSDGFGTRAVAVNMTDSAESDISPRAKIYVQEGNSDNRRSRQERPLWSSVLLAAALLLAAEWWLWAKRW
jgi:hypothetical protein